MIITSFFFIFNFMINKRIVLGSGSPRRKELIASLGVPFRIEIKSIDETVPSTIPIEQAALYLAQQKALPLIDSIVKDEVLLTSDTIVLHDNTILGKPRDAHEAKTMLETLSNDCNEVITGVYLTDGNHIEAFSVNTKVYFKALTSDEIAYYINKFQPFDKAGAYGIQEWIGKIGVQRIEGCFYNVMGLPIAKVWEKLLKFSEN